MGGVNQPEGRLTLLTRVQPPRNGNPSSRDLSQGAQRFGPFQVGTIVRITCAIGNVWYVFGADDVVATSRANGDPLGAWDRVEHEVTDEDVMYVSVVLDADSATGWGDVYRTGISRKGC